MDPIQSAPGGGEYRRRYPRRTFKRKLGLLHSGKYWVGHGVEIGEGGISFMLAQSLEQGHLLVVNFQIPDGTFVSVQGEVRNIRKDSSGLFAYGISFRTLKFEYKREIRAFVSARTESES